MSAATTLGRRRLPAAVPAAIALAWAAAAAAHASGLAGVGGYALLWCVMVAAMMLPSAVPLLRLFTEVSAAQAGRGRVLACFAGGYLAVWALFGGRRWCSTTSSTA